MPSKSEKQQKFFQIVKAYKDKKMSAAAGAQSAGLAAGGTAAGSGTEEYNKSLQIFDCTL